MISTDALANAIEKANATKPVYVGRVTKLGEHYGKFVSHNGLVKSKKAKPIVMMVNDNPANFAAMVEYLDITAEQIEVIQLNKKGK